MEPAHLLAAGAPTGLPDLQLLIYAVLLVLLAGLASMTDAALATVSPARAAELAREGERGAALARLTATSGMGLAISPVVCGWIAQRFGIDWMFAAMSVVGIAAAFGPARQALGIQPTEALRAD